jgi:HK97 family phage portal protein
VSLFRRSVGELLAEPGRPPRRQGGPAVTNASALRQSVVWSARRLRADLISMMPVDVFRRVPGKGIINVPVTPPPVLVTPSDIADGHPMFIGEWLYSGQMSLDGSGNSVGVIRAVDALGLPARIELVADELVSMRIRGGRVLEYRINGEKHEARDIWHERQFTVAGLPVGLSPIAFAALNLASGIAAQEFALDWFANGAVPSAILANVEKKVDPDEADRTKRRFKAAIADGDVFVTGKDWTYTAVAAKAAESQFIEQMQYTDLALCRFFGVPADLVDVVVQGSSTINYANITQRNLQMLVMHLGPSVKRREDALSTLTAKPRFVKLNRSAILAMDPKSRAELLNLQIDGRVLTPDQAREIEDLPPLSEFDYAQFDRLFGARTKPQPRTSGGT